MTFDGGTVIDENCGMNDFIKVAGARDTTSRTSRSISRSGRSPSSPGLSGSGKSSLVFDTIASEAQRQLNETFTAFVRNFLPSYSQPDIDSIENISTAIVIDQKRIGGNSRSTVGTITDINLLMRLLYSRVAKPHIGWSNVFSFNDPQGMWATSRSASH